MARSDVAGVDTCPGKHEAVRRLSRSPCCPVGRRTRTVSRAASSARALDSAAFGLAHDLAGDDDDVTVDQIRTRADQGGEVVVQSRPPAMAS